MEIFYKYLTTRHFRVTQDAIFPLIPTLINATYLNTP